MTRWRSSICIAALFGNGALHEAKAETVCAGLKTIVKSATGKFAAIREPRAHGDFNGKVSLGPLKRCEASERESTASYRCMDAYLPADTAQKTMGEIVAEIEKCFGKDVERSLNSPNTVMFDYVPNENLTIDISTGQRGGVVLTVDFAAP